VQPSGGSPEHPLLRRSAMAVRSAPGMAPVTRKDRGVVRRNWRSRLRRDPACLSESISRRDAEPAAVRNVGGLPRHVCVEAV
jgi:hypothetical protein